jgi:hypothetical protein
MHDALRQMFVGLSSIFVAPTVDMPQPNLRITLPPESATKAIGQDFSRIAGDFQRAMGKADQLEFKI